MSELRAYHERKNKLKEVEEKNDKVVKLLDDLFNKDLRIKHLEFHLKDKDTEIKRVERLLKSKYKLVIYAYIRNKAINKLQAML